MASRFGSLFRDRLRPLELRHVDSRAMRQQVELSHSTPKSKQSMLPPANDSGHGRIFGAPGRKMILEHTATPLGPSNRYATPEVRLDSECSAHERAVAT